MCTILKTVHILARISNKLECGPANKKQKNPYPVSSKDANKQGQRNDPNTDDVIEACGKFSQDCSVQTHRKHGLPEEKKIVHSICLIKQRTCLHIN